MYYIKGHSYLFKEQKVFCLDTETICIIAEIREFDWIMMAVKCVGQIGGSFPGIKGLATVKALNSVKNQ